MKNIAISGTWRFSFPGSNITTAIVDVDSACLWIAKERLNADADVEVDIYKKGLPDDSYEMEDVSFALNFVLGLVLQDNADSLRLQVAPTELVAKLVSCTSRLVSDSTSQVASLRSVAGEESLVVITRGGDISSMKLGNPDPQARSRCLLIPQIDILIKSSSSSRLLARLRMACKQLHGVRMIRCSSSLQVGPHAIPSALFV